MANYGVSGDIRETLGNPTETEVSAASVSLAQKKATNIINGYLEKAYPGQVPFASSDVPALVDTLATDLSVYFIKRDKHPGPAPLSEDVKEEFWNKPIAMLEKIVDEKMSLAELTASAPSTILAKRSQYTPTFGVGGELDSVVDQDAISDEAEDRE